MTEVIIPPFMPRLTNGDDNLVNGDSGIGNRYGVWVQSGEVDFQGGNDTFKAIGMSTDYSIFTIAQLVEGFSQNAIYNEFVRGEDLNNDGIVSLEELLDRGAIFTGNSPIPNFDLTIANIVTTEANEYEYNYGDSLLDPSDDISLNYTLFLADPANNLFVKIETDNNYFSKSGTTNISQYSSSEFVNIENIERTTQPIEITVTPEDGNGYGIFIDAGASVMGGEDNDSFQGNGIGINMGMGIGNLGEISTNQGDDTIIGEGNYSDTNVGIINYSLANISGGEGNDSIQGIASYDSISEDLYNLLNSDMNDLQGDELTLPETRESSFRYGIYNYYFSNISGDQGNDTIIGESNDIIEGESTYNFLAVGLSNILNSNISGGEGNDILQFEAINNVFSFGVYNWHYSVISGDEGDDIMTAKGFGTEEGYGIYNQLFSVIDMGNGEDQIIAEGSTLGIYNDSDILLGGGNDTISASSDIAFFDYYGSGTIFLGDGNDEIYGFGIQTIDGGDGLDTAYFDFGVDMVNVNKINDNSVDLTVDGVTMSFTALDLFNFSGTTLSFNDVVLL